jgi:hypothetical protein
MHKKSLLKRLRAKVEKMMEGGSSMQDGRKCSI